MIGFYDPFRFRYVSQIPAAGKDNSPQFAICLQFLRLFCVVLVGRIRDCVAALRKVLAGAGYRITSCECGGSDDQQQSDESSHEKFPLSLMRVR